MKGNNTYTGDGDDLDLVTLEENKQGEKKRKRLNDSVEGEVKKKNRKRKQGSQRKIFAWKKSTTSIFESTNAQGEKEGEGQRKGCIVHTVIESKNNLLKNKQSYHSNKYAWPEIQQQYTAGRDCGMDPARKSAPHYNKAFYGKVR